MKLIEVLARLTRAEQPVLRTADVLSILDMDPAAGSKALARLAEHEHVARLKRGLWVIRGGRDPLSLAPYLTAPFPSYISLYTALYHHGMISQVPSVVYCVSLARTRRYTTPVGVFSVHHISEEFFGGYEPAGRDGVLMAVPEKALLDCLYLAPARSKFFRALPELELPRGFSASKARRMLSGIGDIRRRDLVRARLAEALGSLT